MKKIGLLAGFLLFFSVLLVAQENSYKQILHKMLEVSGSVESFKPSIKRMMKVYQKEYTGISSEQWAAKEKEIVSLSVDDLVDLLVPVYQKYLSQSDLEKIIAFYETPVGKKYARETPKLTQESMMLGRPLAALVYQHVTEMADANPKK